MSPFHRAQIVYTQEQCRRDFWSDLHLHLSSGYIFSTPEAFVMGRPVDRHADPELIVHPAVEFDNPDTWLIYLAAGDGLGLFLKYEPFPLPWYGWERKNKLRFYERARIVGKLR